MPIPSHKSPRLLAAIVLLPFMPLPGPGQISSQSYSELHFGKVRKLLSPHSALPPVLDLSRPSLSRTAAGRAWEKKFTGSMLAREIKDPGTQPPYGPGSISATTIEYGSHMPTLQARSCDAVIIGKPITAEAHLAYTHRLVYSTFRVEIIQVLKGGREHDVQQGKQIVAAQRGGTIRFPSGHLETFIWTGEGFIEPDKQYLLFLWKPIRTDNIYMVAEPYLVQNDRVFPVDGVGEMSSYEGMAFEKFEAKVKAAIAKNIDTD